MSSLSIAALCVGAVFIVLYIPALVAPEATRRAVLAFPRSSIAAYALTAVDLIWVMVLILGADLGRFEHLKPWVYAAGPVSFFLLNRYMEELLAPRALGGLFLLAAAPILNAARWHDSPARLLLTTIVYIAVIKGILFVLSPYRFRHLAEIWIKNEARLRAGALAMIGIGALLIVFALTLYR